MQTSIDWDGLGKRHEDLTNALLAPTIAASDREAMQKELVYINRLLEKKRELNVLAGLISHTESDIADSDDEEMRALLQQDLGTLKSKLQEEEKALEGLLVPPDEHDDRSVFLEIRAGAGGQEAALFAADLVRMYTNYAIARGWNVSVVGQSLTDLGGIKDVTLHIKGQNVFGALKREAGVHRVQRVPKTESSGRVHTSTVTVAVLPEAKEVDVNINPADLRIDVFRASGAGGQHVNTTDSAVRITHLPTGVVVTCQDERSQHKNKAKAMKMLQSRLLAYEIEKHEREIGKKRQEMVGKGMRAEKVRTYNFPQNRVTDHQVDLTLKKLDLVMEGDLEGIVQALQEKERQKKREQMFKGN